MSRFQAAGHNFGFVQITLQNQELPQPDNVRPYTEPGVYAVEISACAEMAEWARR